MAVDKQLSNEIHITYPLKLLKHCGCYNILLAMRFFGGNALEYSFILHAKFRF